ncbi:MAG TPA: SAM hydroxide adenosyltransferase, partial [Acidimicrobiales bacterium]
LGPEVDPLSLLPGLVPLTNVEEGSVRGEVLWVDRYGNVQLNVDPEEIEPFGERLMVTWGDAGVRRARRAATYGDIRPGELGVVVDSYGLISLAFDRLSAAAELKLRTGDSVLIAAPS